MKISELIEKLKEFDPQMQVVVFGGDTCDLFYVSTVEKTKALLQDDGSYLPRDEDFIDCGIYDDDDLTLRREVVLIDC